MRVLTVALALTTLVVLVACGGSNDPVEDHETPAVVTTLPEPEQPDVLSPTRSPYPAMPDTRSREERLAQMEDELEPSTEVVTPEPDLPPGQDNVKLIDLGLSTSPSGLRTIGAHVVGTRIVPNEGERVYRQPAERLLRVIGVEDCLNMRAEPYIEAEVVNCIPLSAYVDPFTDVAMTGRDGITWRWVSYSVGEGSPNPHGEPGGENGLGLGFASAKYLEGADPSQTIGPQAYVAPEEFPDGAAALVRPFWPAWLVRPTDTTSGPVDRLDRIYRRADGEVVRETLMTLEDLAAAHPAAFAKILAGDHANLKYAGIVPGHLRATADGSHIYAAVCPSARGGGLRPWQIFCYDPLTIFQSTDGGVTWNYMDRLSRQEAGDGLQVVGLLPGDEPQLVVWAGSEIVLFPSGESRTLDPVRIGVREPDVVYVGDWSPLGILASPLSLLPDGRIVMEMWSDGLLSLESAPGTTETDLKTTWVTEDGEVLGEELPDHLKPSLPSIPIPSHLYQHYLPGDDPPEGRPTYYHVEHLPRLAIQHGPFLRVVGVGDDCLPLKAEPLPDAEELDCVTERVLLQDQGEKTIDVDNVIWRKAKTLAGIEGWADGRYLER